MKGALHVHTTFSDGCLAPGDMLRVYRDMGFDFVALTDHDYFMKPGAYDELPEQFEGMLVFRGVEKTVFARGYLHINQICGEEEHLHILNHPAAFATSVAQVLERLAAIEPSITIDAVEVSKNGFYTPEYDVAEIPYPKVVSDDSHTREGCGRAWIEVDCEKDKDAIIRAIKNGRARNRYNGTAHQTVWSDWRGNCNE